MNVLSIMDYRTPNSGNFIASLIELANRMKENGQKMVFLVPYTPLGYTWVGWIEKNGHEVICFNEKDSTLDVVQSLNEIIHIHNIQIIHSHFGYLHRVLVDNAKEFNAKIIFHDHMDYAFGTSFVKQKIKQTVRGFFYRLKGIGVISVMKKKDKGYWICGKKLHWYVPNGLSLKRNINESLSREECRRKLNILDDERLCLFLGWDIKRKGVDIAIKAIEKCRGKNTNICLGIIGFGGNPKQEVLDRIKSSIDLEPSQVWIRFLDSTEDMFAYHRASDVYLSASRSEAFSYGILEAISQNVPVVVSDIEGTSWALEYSKCLQYETENVDMCADMISKAIDMRFNNSNNDEIINKYSIQKWCTEIIDIYNQMMGCNETSF